MSFQQVNDQEKNHQIEDIQQSLIIQSHSQTNIDNLQQSKQAYSDYTLENSSHQENQISFKNKPTLVRNLKSIFDNNDVYKSISNWSQISLFINIFFFYEEIFYLRKAQCLVIVLLTIATSFLVVQANIYIRYDQCIRQFKDFLWFVFDSKSKAIFRTFQIIPLISIVILNLNLLWHFLSFFLLKLNIIWLENNSSVFINVLGAQQLNNDNLTVIKFKIFLFILIYIFASKFLLKRKPVIISKTSNVLILLIIILVFFIQSANQKSIWEYYQQQIQQRNSITNYVSIIKLILQTSCINYINLSIYYQRIKNANNKTKQEISLFYQKKNIKTHFLSFLIIIILYFVIPQQIQICPLSFSLIRINLDFNNQYLSFLYTFVIFISTLVLIYGTISYYINIKTLFFKRQKKEKQKRRFQNYVYSLIPFLICCLLVVINPDYQLYTLIIPLFITAFTNLFLLCFSLVYNNYKNQHYKYSFYIFAFIITVSILQISCTWSIF